MKTHRITRSAFARTRLSASRWALTPLLLAALAFGPAGPRAWAVDANHDGMDDLWQARFEVAPFSGAVNSDGDARINLVEALNFSDPNAADSGWGHVHITDANGDGLDDRWQAQYNVPAAQKYWDPDGDQRTNWEESIVGSHPFVADTPWGGGGASPSAAAGPLDFTLALPYTLPGKRYQLQISDDVESWSAAADVPAFWGTGAAQSITAGTGGAPRMFFRFLLDDPDNDLDGLADWHELHVFFTSTSNADSDGDGYTDGDEVRYAANPSDDEDDPLLQLQLRITAIEARISAYHAIADTLDTLAQRDGLWGGIQADLVIIHDAITDIQMLYPAANTQPVQNAADAAQNAAGARPPSMAYLEVAFVNSDYSEGRDIGYDQEWIWENGSWNKVDDGLTINYGEWHTISGSWVDSDGDQGTNGSVADAQSRVCGETFLDLRQAVEPYLWMAANGSYTGENIVGSDAHLRPPLSSGSVDGQTDITQGMETETKTWQGEVRILRLARTAEGDPNVELTDSLVITSSESGSNNAGLPTQALVMLTILAGETHSAQAVEMSAQPSSSGASLTVSAASAVTLTQLNMPNFGEDPDNSTDLGVIYGTENIGAGGIAYITGEPEMPQLAAKFANAPANTTIDWVLKIKSERRERGTKDNKSYSGQTTSAAQGDQTWNIQFGSDFVGGSCALSYRVNNGPEGRLTFFIRGKNPLDADARDYVENHAQAANFPYAWAMVQHESRQGNRCYNQFNSGGDGLLNYELPNFTGPDGWGIAQLDEPLGVSASTKEVYHWKENIEKFYQEMVQKQQATDRFFAAVARTYPNDPDAAAPPAAYTVPGTHTAYSAEQLSTMILYNGAAGCPYSVLKNGNGNATTEFQNPWSFNSSRNPKWQFTDNENEYAVDVIQGEIEETYSVEE